MREILFKGICKGNGWRADGRFTDGEWVYGSLVLRKAGPEIYFQDPKEPGKAIYGATHNVKVDPDSVCEYIGIEDRTGAKVFEGDIVACKSDLSGQTYFYEVVCGKFANFEVKDIERGDIESVYIITSYGEIEIVGNVHDKVTAESRMAV